MVISDQKVGVLTYSIYTENIHGELLEEATESEPRTLLFGSGRLLRSFEERLKGLKTGDEFAFTLDSGEAFGQYRQDMIMQIPLTAFVINGQIREGMLDIGSIVPMMDSEGTALNGRVLEVNDEKVTMDFNHPLAGKNLYTFGKVLHVREATYEELNPAPSGCGCGTPSDACCGGSEQMDHNHHHHHEHQHEHQH
jgi:FKBP-type peptidyl-prolyl cis-trans isomerase SlyD